MFRTWLRLLLNKKKSVLISTSRPSPYKHNYSERNETKSNIKMFTDYIIVLIEQNELFDANEFRRFLARYESVPAEQVFSIIINKSNMICFIFNQFSLCFIFCSLEIVQAKAKQPNKTDELEKKTYFAHNNKRRRM